MELFEPFPNTQEGYKKAKKYLKKIGMWSMVSKKGFSTDGYSIINEANSIFKRINGANKL